MRLIAFTGYARSGKDSAAQALINAGWVKVAFADAVRDALLALNPLVQGSEGYGGAMRLSTLVNHRGWDYAKQHDEVRRLLQRMGTEAGRAIHGAECWTDIAREKVYDVLSQGGKAVITDCRFPNEAQRVRHWGGLVVRIDRPGVGPVNGHTSDSLEGIEPDCVIVNDGTVEDLHRKVLGLVDGGGNVGDTTPGPAADRRADPADSGRD